MENTLYYGDNLDILRRYIPDESVDLVYLDPPFNSNQNYNVLFKEKNGAQAASQIRAFADTWSWGQDGEEVFAEIVTKGGKVADCLQAFRTFLGPCDMLAYLVMMAPRLVELRRALKPTGSIYLHCDPAASHYLKLLMDSAFGGQFFCNEIIWERTNVHNDARRKYPDVSDTILFYSKSNQYLFNTQYMAYSDDHINSCYKYRDDKGRRYSTRDLRSPHPRPNLTYEYKGYKPHPNGWSISKEKMAEYDKLGLIAFPKSFAGRLRLKIYLDEMPGTPVRNIWNDIKPIQAQAAERLGYPTQKPEALLARIIKASSNEGDIILDPFCGCGTTIAAAQKLNRRWIGIDITYLAIALIKNRLADMFGEASVPKVIGEPQSVPDAQALAESDPYQFQWWALGLVDARPVEEKKGSDKGIDGKIIFQGDTAGKFETVILSVKAGGTGAAHVRDLKGVLDREKAAIGVLISMEEPTKPMHTEAVTAGFFESTTWGKKYPKIQLLTIAELLAGKKIDMPPIRQVGATFKKAEKFKAKGGEQLEINEKLK